MNALMINSQCMQDGRALQIAVFIIQPAVLSSIAALTRQTSSRWDDMAVGVAAELTQTSLFIYFCDFQPLKTALLLIPCALQLSLSVAEHWPRDSAAVSADGGLCSSWLKVSCLKAFTNADWRLEMALLSFGAVSTMLPFLIEMPTTEGVQLTAANAAADAFAAIVLSSPFQLVVTVMLWGLTVLVQDSSLDARSRPKVWSQLVQGVSVFLIGYATRRHRSLRQHMAPPVAHASAFVGTRRRHGVPVYCVLWSHLHGAMLQAPHIRRPGGAQG